MSAESVIQLDLSRQKFYMNPDDPLPKFYPPPRAIQVTPIYDTPLPDNGPSSLFERPGPDQPSSTRSSRNGPTSPLINNESDPKFHEAPSSRHGGLPHAYSPARDQRYDPDPYYPEHLYSRSYLPDRSRRRQSFDHDDSSDDSRPRDNDYSDYDRSSDYDRYPPDSDRSSLDNYRPSPQQHHQSSSQPNRSAHHEESPPRPNRSAYHEESSPQPNYSTYPEAGSPQPNRSTYHEPERQTRAINPISALQKYLENNRRAAHQDPFEHLRSLPEEIQRVLKAIPPSPQFCWSECTGQRKAVCVGINYVGQKNQLKGCANDARHMRSFLMKYHQFKSQNILLLADDGQAVSMKPTRKNMFDAMSWLVKGAKQHDSLFFHYSGHGGQTKDETGKECDGMDEVIFPVDFQSTSHIVDNDLFTALVAPLPVGCRLTAVFDSCHSGTVLDLPYLHSAHGRIRSLAHITLRAQKRGVAPGADVICFAGCKDDGTSADTFEGGIAVGAMSYALLKILKGVAVNQTHITYGQILQQLRAILISKYSQKPQISGTHPIDLDREFTL